MYEKDNEWVKAFRRWKDLVKFMRDNDTKEYWDEAEANFAKFTEAFIIAQKFKEIVTFVSKVPKEEVD